MRYDAPFLVKRYGPMIGRPYSRWRITVAYQAYTLAEALDRAAVLARLDAVWIETRGQPAARIARRTVYCQRCRQPDGECLCQPGSTVPPPETRSAR